MKNCTLAFLLFFCFQFSLQSQDFMLQGWYWDYPKPATPMNASSQTWAKTLNAQVSDLSNAGFTHLWLPPMSRASFGSNSNGYDPQDLYDLGEFGQGATGFGFRSDVDALITSCNTNGIEAVADVVYNHRDGGKPELNPAVKDYITVHMSSGKSPFPSDRYQCYLPLGGTTGNGAGDYYFKISSKTASYGNYQYRVYMTTNQVGWQGLADTTEVEPNGGGDCGEGFNTIQLGRNTIADIEATGCLTDEFKLTLNASDFNAAGDTLIIRLTNTGGYSDHRIYGIWNASANADVVSQLQYQTYTDFTSMPSGQGGMNYQDFKPNSTNASTTFLGGDWDWLWFFYDYDQSNSSTATKLADWTKWLWNDVGIRGFRMDAVKHFPASFVGGLLNSLNASSMNPSMVVGEFFDSNPALLNTWVSDVYASMNATTSSNINVRVFDFSLRSALKNACDQFGYDVRNVFGASLVDNQGMSGFNVVTFLNNHDFRHSGEPVWNDPELAYAYLLTNNQLGIPCVFYPEYAGTTVSPYPAVNLKTEIDELINVHQQYITGANQRHYLNASGSGYASNFISGASQNSLIYQLSGGVGGGEVVVAINFSGQTLQVDHQINTANIGVGSTLTDVLGNSAFPTAVVSGSSQIYIELPPRSYSVWVATSVLPVELAHFAAAPKTNCIQLDWISETEEQFSHYELERSLDGKSFEFLARFEGKGGLEKASYDYADCRVEKNKLYYYRLKMVDLDETIEYSSIESARIKNDGLNAISVTPNPWRNELRVIRSGDQNGNILLNLYNASGKPVWEGALSPNDNQLIIEGNLPSGMYSMKWRSDNEEGSIQLLKQ